MTIKYLFSCLIALLVISGCIDRQLTQAEKVGWDETRYEMYSKLYDSIYEYDYDSSPAYTIADMKQRRAFAQAKLFKIDEERTKIYPENQYITEFEEMWGLAFLSYKIGLVGVNMSYDMQIPLRDGTLKDTPEAKEYRGKTKSMFNYSLEYRQKIEEWNPSRQR